MSATIYDSKPLAARMAEELRVEAAQFRKRHHRPARLAQLVAGHDAAAEVYSRQLVRSCRAIGLGCATLAYPFEIEEEELRAEVAALNDDANTDGVVLLLPLPAHIRQRIVTDDLRPEKDVDGLGSRNAGNLLLGFPTFGIQSQSDNPQKLRTTAYNFYIQDDWKIARRLTLNLGLRYEFDTPPVDPHNRMAILAVLRDADLSVAGSNAVVVGRSNIGGKPVALVLLRQDATITICHSYTQDLASITRSADILVVSTGRPGSITADMVKPGAIVLDAGINTVNGKVVGDIDFVGVKEVASFLTPVPGGLGPLTHLMLIRHTLLGPQ